MTTTDVVPLPETLGSCACPGRPNRHLTTCAVAIAFDEGPRTYEQGKRYACVSWDYPLRISGSYHIEVELDPVEVIKAHLDEYRAFEMDGAHYEWEKPMAFLCHLIEEQIEVGVFFGQRRLSQDRSYLDELRESHWTAEDTERLEAALAAIPDPNQEHQLRASARWRT